MIRLTGKSLAHQGARTKMQHQRRTKMLRHDGVRCGICHEALCEPVTFCCGLSACELCVSQWVEHQLSEDPAMSSLRCPLGCGSQHALSLPRVSIQLRERVQEHIGKAEYLARQDRQRPEHDQVQRLRAELVTQGLQLEVWKGVELAAWKRHAAYLEAAWKNHAEELVENATEQRSQHALQETSQPCVSCEMMTGAWYLVAIVCILLGQCVFAAVYMNGLSF